MKLGKAIFTKMTGGASSQIIIEGDPLGLCGPTHSALDGLSSVSIGQSRILYKRGRVHTLMKHPAQGERIVLTVESLICMLLP